MKNLKMILKRSTSYMLAIVIMGSFFTGCGTKTEIKNSEDTKKVVVSKKDLNIKEIKIGFVNELTGAMSSGGISVHNGEETAVDLINEKGGVMGKYKITPIYSDDKSDVNLAASETERLIKEEKVPIISGAYPSSFGMKMAEVCENNKTIYWCQTPSTDLLLKDMNRKYIFRVQPMGSDWGKSGIDFLNSNYEKLGVSKVSDLKIGIVNENSQFGTYVANSNESQGKLYGMNIVYKQDYDKAVIKDFNPIVNKLIENKVDVLFLSAYNADMILFLKSVKELNFKPKVVIGHGAGFGFLPDIAKEVGEDMINYFYDSEPPLIQLIQKDKLSAEAYELNQKAIQIAKDKYNDPNPNGYFALSFVNTYLLFDKVIPLAIEKYGEVTSESVRKAALEIDIPEKSIGLGYGVKFAPEGDQFAGQNIKGFAYIMQYVNGEMGFVWPERFKSQEGILPFPSDSFYSK